MAIPVPDESACVSVVMDQVGKVVNAAAGVASYFTGNAAIAKAKAPWNFWDLAHVKQLQYFLTAKSLLATLQVQIFIQVSEVMVHAC